MTPCKRSKGRQNICQPETRTSEVRSDALLACPFCERGVELNHCACAYEVRCNPCDLIFPVHGCIDKDALVKRGNTRHANCR